MRPKTLDHVALWVADRDAITDFLTERLSMHVIERTDKFTLVGTNARRGKLTLFAEEGPREQGALKHIALRVNDLGKALGGLEGIAVDRQNGSAYFDVEEGLRLGLVEAETDVEYDLDHVALFSNDPEGTSREYERYGFHQASPSAEGNPRVEVGGAYVEFHQGDPGDPERPLLNHLAVLVDSADEHKSEAEEAGIEVADYVDAPNTLAVFVWLPERVKLEYVEHKPTFSLV
jgi:catechol 2,3-dioxygenase-like lactoylglutathione lyase family enzyme